MKIAILGSGGREHALTVSISKSSKIEKIYCIPGNAGTSEIATNIDLDINDFDILYNFLNENKIDLVVVGPEQPLVNGIVDYLEKFNIKVFGPNKIASQLEGSKIFTKKLCEEYNIPTAKFGILNNKIDAKKFLENSKYPNVIKADNLASGKGVYICNNEEESNMAIEEIFNGRVLEGDKGKNTGGMGAYSPSRLINSQLEEKILKKIIQPTLLGLSKLGTNYKGFLYAGLMIVKDEPYLIEYNVRMGDPECQTILPKLQTNLTDILLACCDQTLDKIEINWSDKKSICIVMCSKGYPDEFEKNIEIENLDNIKLDINENLFHAGTTKKDNKIYATGGRVLNFVSISDNFTTAKKNIIKNLDKLNWTGGFYRKDIGYKVID